MHYDQFIGQVQHRARLGTSEEAVRAIRCALGVLAERLQGGEVKDLASQLPEEIGYYLGHSEAGQGLRLAFDDFVERVTFCERVPKPQAIFHARVVFEVMREAVSGGEIDHILGQLPREFRELVCAGSQGSFSLKRKSSRRRAGNATASGRKRSAGQAAGVRLSGTSAEREQPTPRSKRLATRAAEARHLGR